MGDQKRREIEYLLARADESAQRGAVITPRYYRRRAGDLLRELEEEQRRVDALIAQRRSRL